MVPQMHAAQPPGRVEMRHRSVAALTRAIREFIAVTNDAPKPFVWTKSADEILASIARFAQRTLAAHPA